MASLEGARSALVEAALRKASPVEALEALFDHDARQLVQLPTQSAVRAQLTLLERDTGALENSSYIKQRVWTSFAGFVERRTVPSCARQVFERMLSLGIAKYYKEFYESWGALEIRAGMTDNARQVLATGVQNKVFDDKVAEQVFQGWLQAHSEADGDETIALTSGPAVASSRVKSNTSEPTIVFSKERKTVAGLANSSIPTSTASSTTSMPSATKKQDKKVTIMLPTGAGTKKLGKAKRVVVSNDSVENSCDTTAELPTISENAATPASTKESILERIGDVSYIKQWTPAAPPTIEFSEPNQTISFKAPNKTSEAETCGSGDDLTSTYHGKQVTVTFHEYAPPGGRDHRSSASADRTSSVSSNGSSGETAPREPASSKESGGNLSSFHQSLLSPKNLFVVNGQPYLRLAVIGRGGSSKVFKVLSVGPDVGEPQTYALKRIKLQKTDQQSISSFINEITLLKRLRGNSNIITLVDSQVDLENKVIYMVMEHGEIDLNTMLAQQSQSPAVGQCKAGMVGQLSVNFVRLTWMNMLEAVHAIHEERIVHGDLKPANFLFVKGKLKLIDFGIAKAISNDTTNIMRDTQVGTLNYMSPESIIDTSSAAGSRPRIGAPGMRLKQGRASDIWSLGCILYQMVYGHTPFHDLKLIQKIHCISDPNYKIQFPEVEQHDLVDVVKSCLRFNPADRPPIAGSPCALLGHSFLNPSSGSRTPGPSVSIRVAEIVRDVLEHATELKSLSAQRFDEAVEALAARHGGLVNVVGKQVAQQSSVQNRAPAAAPLAPLQLSAAAQLAARAQTGSENKENALQKSILSGKAGLKSLQTSASSRFMRPKGSTPDKHIDMETLLRRGLESKREILESHDNTIEAIVRSGNTWDFLAE